MSAIYDNWERLVAAVLKKQQLWELFHQQSRSPSIRSEASDLSSSSYNFSDLASEFSSSSKWQKSYRCLVLVSDFCPRFDVKDVSRASCVLIGRGTFGSAYTATIDDGPRIVVKRLKSANVSEVDFRRYMEIVGDVMHENVVGLRAYYSSQDQRLMIYDYYENGSVFSLLYGQRYENQVHVDWETRLKIAIGAARGIAAIHRELGGMLAHGNIKASNVFINLESYGCISDLGLASMIKTTFDSTARCHAPEVKNTQNISHASDVYGFGVLLLELLTRRSSVDVPGGPAAVDLVKLVNSVKSKERAAKVFDADLLKHPSINEQMVKVLKIGMQCVEKSIKKRPKMFEVVKMLEDIMTSNPVSQERQRLEFVGDANPMFDLEDILRASAEVLGKGTFGTCYLAKLENGNTVVVKRLKDVIVSFKVFQQLMEALGRLEHKNVVKLWAYYYSNDEKLLVYDYYHQASVYAMLHRESGTHVEWGARLQIAVGAARGIAHIHGQKTVHGNVKSSNIFINGQTYGIVSDTGLMKLMDPMSLAKVLSRGYRAPEIKATGKVSQACDVYSFGVVLLELVCGRPSQHTTEDGVRTKLVKWVQAAVVDNLEINGIFDVKCLRHETEEAMKHVFQIAMDCVSNVPEQRPTMTQVVEVLEEISGIIIEPEQDSTITQVVEVLEEISGIIIEPEQDSWDWEQLSFDSKLEYVLEDLLPTLTL